MDAVRRFALLVPLMAVVASCGCSLFDTPDDTPQQYNHDPARDRRDIEQQRADSAAKYLAMPPEQRMPIARPQAPVGPSGPIAMPGRVEVPNVPAPAAGRVVPASGPTPDSAATQIRVVAMIGQDVVITDDEVWQLVRQRAGEYVKLVGTERDAKEKALFREELRMLIDRELLLNDILGKLKKNKPQVLDELYEEARRTSARQLKEFKKMNNFKTEAEFTEALRHQGLSMKGLQRQLERNALKNMYLQQVMKDKGKGASLAEVVRYYDEHPDEFKVEDRAKWLDLFVSYRRFETTVEARKYAEGLLRQAQTGADFVKLVKQHGHGDSPLRDGVGTGEKRGEVTPRELEQTIFALNTGQVSGIVATETGFHIVKVVEREVAGFRPFDEKVQMYIRNKLAIGVQKAEYDRLIEDLWRKTTVRIIDTP